MYLPVDAARGNMFLVMFLLILVGGIPTPLENMNQLGLVIPICGKIKHVPNDQPVYTNFLLNTSSTHPLNT